ncbi:MAG: quinone oxidoreductase family protein [Anaerolineae bacterium]
MKAIRVHEHGDAAVLTYEEIPTPEPGPAEVLIEIEAAGVNFVDIYHCKGLYDASLPLTLGVEGAGEVAAVGKGVKDFRPGDSVAYAMQQGSYAEFAIVPESQVVHVPENVEPEEAAAVMLQGLTAHYLSHSTYAAGHDDVALVHAAAGGVGGLLVQMLKLRGARVIGTCSTQEKAERARQAGADDIIRYTEVDFEEAVHRLTEGNGVHVVYDGVGQATFRKGLNCLCRRGYMVLYGQASGPVEPLDPQVLNRKGSLFLTRPTLGDYIATRDELERRTSDLFAWMADGELKVSIDRAFPLEEAAAAHRYVEGRKTQGKVLLLP